MGVYVKNMKMPEGCHDCMLGYSCSQSGASKNDGCLLVEIKEPHGKIIDIDKIEMPIMTSDIDEKWMKVALNAAPVEISAE